MIMMRWNQFSIKKWLFSGLSLLILSGILTFGIAWVQPPAIAAIRQLEEGPHQVVYQSRHNLTDQHGRAWQAIAFKRIYPNGKQHIYLRLVGFPGIGNIDRSRPLMLENAMGSRLTLSDASSQIFTDAQQPEPYVGQYDLESVLPEIQVEMPWQLILPLLDQDSLNLNLPSIVIQEWQTLINFT